MRAGFLVAVILVGAADQSHAGFVTSPASFSGSESVINFSTVVQGDPITLQGVTFENLALAYMTSGTNYQTLFSNIPGASRGGALTDFVGQSNINIHFSSTVNRVGMLLSATGVTTWSLEAFDASNTLLGSGSITNPGASQAVFAGFEFSQPFARVRVFENVRNNHVTLIDDLRFEAAASTVPEPTSLALMGIGGIGMFGGWCRKRRKTTVAA